MLQRYLSKCYVYTAFDRWCKKACADLKIASKKFGGGCVFSICPVLFINNLLTDTVANECSLNYVFVRIM